MMDRFVEWLMGLDKRVVWLLAIGLSLSVWALVIVGLLALTGCTTTKAAATVEACGCRATQAASVEAFSGQAAVEAARIKVTPAKP